MNNEHLLERLQAMQNTDIHSVNPGELVDIDSVTIRKELPPEERIRDYVDQIKNPYCYISHGIIVKVTFAGARTLEECLEACMALETADSPLNGIR